MARQCEQCGYKMPMFSPRMRADDGRLLCPGCHPKGKGSESRPIGLHGVHKAPAADPLACESCATPMGEDGLVVEAGKFVCPDGCKTALWTGEGDLWAGHEDHDTVLVSTSWGEKAQCNTCQMIVAVWSEGSDEPLPYIPSGVSYTPPRTASAPLPMPGGSFPPGEGPADHLCPRCGGNPDWCGCTEDEVEEYLGSTAAREQTCPDCRGRGRRGVGVSHSCQTCGGTGKVPGKKAATLRTEASVSACPHCGSAEIAPGWVAQGSQQGFTSGPHPIGCRACGGQWFGPTWFIPFEGWTHTIGKPPPRQASLRTHAHDSGDGATIFHCPFCGSGQVTGRSDGTAECDFCHTAFTVQVQPQMSAMPQTVNGQPSPIPGMPGDHTQPAQNQAPAAPGAPQGAVPGEAPVEPGAPQGPAFVPPVKGNAFVPPTQQVAASRFFLTADGVALPEESFVRHLAIKHADDREAVIAQVKAERRKR